MSRLFMAAAVLVVVMPDVAAMQVLPPTPITLDVPQNPPRPSTPGPGVPVDTQVTPAAPRRPQGQPAPGPAPAAPPPPRKPRGRDLNVQIELTISDQLGTGAPDKRVVSMLIADGVSGRIRSTDNPNVAMLNVDARPEILDNDRVVVEIGIEYRPLASEGTAPAKRPAPLNEQLTVILQNGKPLMVSQAADPIGDRKMTVEVRASILK
jgi:hypothetical protein